MRFLSNAIVSTRDAKTRELSPISRYLVTHEGIYVLCLGTIYLHDILLANRHLEDIAGLARAHVGEHSVQDLVSLGDRALDQTRLVYRDCFYRE